MLYSTTTIQSQNYHTAYSGSAFKYGDYFTKTAYEIYLNTNLLSSVEVDITFFLLLKVLASLLALNLLWVGM